MNITAAWSLGSKNRPGPGNLYAVEDFAGRYPTDRSAGLLAALGGGQQPRTDTQPMRPQAQAQAQQRVPDARNPLAIRHARARLQQAQRSGAIGQQPRGEPTAAWRQVSSALAAQPKPSPAQSLLTVGKKKQLERMMMG